MVPKSQTALGFCIQGELLQWILEMFDESIPRLAFYVYAACYTLHFGQSSGTLDWLNFMIQMKTISRTSCWRLSEPWYIKNTQLSWRYRCPVHLCKHWIIKACTGSFWFSLTWSLIFLLSLLLLINLMDPTREWVGLCVCVCVSLGTLGMSDDVGYDAQMSYDVRNKSR